MALDVDIELDDMEIDDLTELTSEIPETTTYAIDWEQGRIAGKVSEMEALRQYIRKTLMVDRGKFLIYGEEVGSNIRELISAKNLSRAFLETVIPKAVENALDDKRIVSVYDFSFEYPDYDSMIIRFTVDTIYGTESEEVTI